MGEKPEGSCSVEHSVQVCSTKYAGKFCHTPSKKGSAPLVMLIAGKRAGALAGQARQVMGAGVLLVRMQAGWGTQSTQHRTETHMHTQMLMQLQHSL